MVAVVKPIVSDESDVQESVRVAVDIVLVVAHQNRSKAMFQQSTCSPL